LSDDEQQKGIDEYNPQQFAEIRRDMSTDYEGTAKD
jgi:hypothetical protein